jgi:hypothetical protein
MAQHLRCQGCGRYGNGQWENQYAGEVKGQGSEHPNDEDESCDSLRQRQRRPRRSVPSEREQPRRESDGGQDPNRRQDTVQPVGVKGTYPWLRPVMTRRHGHDRQDETEQNEEENPPQAEPQKRPEGT